MTGLQEQRHRSTGWCMARRRGADRYRPLIVAAVGVLATFLLAGAIQLGNSITGLRREIQDLTSEIDNLEARRALLAVRWNTASSRQVVMRRAETELELICPDAPGTIIVAAAETDDASPSWSRLLPRLAMNNPLPAAIAGETSP